jgi:hypothetical protein
MGLFRYPRQVIAWMEVGFICRIIVSLFLHFLSGEKDEN